MNLKLKPTPNYLNSIIEKEELKTSVKNSLLNYLKLAQYPEEIIEEIVNEDFISSNPSYYLYYPYLFKDYFQVENGEILDLLSISGFLYYKAIILIDDIFDNKHSKNSFHKFFIANICQEETIKILSSLFPIDSVFWKTWNIRKFEYVKAFKLDKTLNYIEDLKEFEDLADFKSTFGKIAIDSLYHLSNKKEGKLYKTLLESHKYFYVGFQIMDDIMDFNEDVENKQFNISRHELIDILNKENDSIENYSLENQRKLMYLKDVAEGLYKKAIKYLSTSSEKIENYSNGENSLWSNEIDSLYNTGITHLLNIKGFVDIHNVKQSLSSKINKESTVGQTIKNAIKFLESNTRQNNSWGDIFNDAGISDIWATSFVIYYLDGLLPKFKIEKSKSYILENRTSNSLWGYNEMWIDDADSSSFALLALKDKKNEIAKSIRNWLNYQNADGGFKTYNDKDILLSSLNNPSIRNVNGWLQSHFCVSAVAFLVFIELEISGESGFDFLRNYIIQKLKSENQILSYWWDNDIYVISFVLLGAIKIKDAQIINLCEERIGKIVEHEKELNYFFKGFLLMALCLSDNLYLKHSKCIKRIVNSITSNQFEDGSWEGGYSLRIPHMSVLDANNQNITWGKGNKGTNVLVKDYNRVFTTVSCMSALKIYESRI